MAVDAAAATGSLRTLGTGALTAATGTHTTPAMTATVAGHVPTPPNNTTTFLRGDGTFAAPGTDISARVTHSVSQSVADNTFFTLAFNTERFDTDTMHDNTTNNSRLTATTAGKYLIIGEARWSTNGNGMRLWQLRINGGAVLAELVIDPMTVAGQPTDAMVSTITNLAATDYVEFRVYQTSGVALDITVFAQSSPEFMMIKILG